jgi:hypothetical protein
MIVLPARRPRRTCRRRNDESSLPLPSSRRRGMLVVMARPLAKVVALITPKRRWAQFSLATVVRGSDRLLHVVGQLCAPGPSFGVPRLLIGDDLSNERA